MLLLVALLLFLVTLEQYIFGAEITPKVPTASLVWPLNSTVACPSGIAQHPLSNMHLRGILSILVTLSGNGNGVLRTCGRQAFFQRCCMRSRFNTRQQLDHGSGVRDTDRGGLGSTGTKLEYSKGGAGGKELRRTRTCMGFLS